MTSILDFLGMGGFRAPNPDVELVAEYAKEAAAAYLKDNIPLNDTITRIAKTASLTPETVEMVCWDANKAVHAAKFASASDKCIEFGLADCKEILKALQQGDMPKTASQVAQEDWARDYALAPGESATTDMSKVASGGHDGTGRDAYPVKYRAHYEMDQLRKEAAGISDELVTLKLSIEQNELDFVKAAREELLQIPYQKRPEGFELLAKFASGCGMAPTHTKHILVKLAAVAVKQGLMEKNASVDQHISDSIAAQCRVVNGNHRLYKLINTLRSEYERREMLEDRYSSVQTKQENLQERIRLM